MNNKHNDNPANNEYTLAQLSDLQSEQYSDLIRAASTLKDLIPDIMDFPVVLPHYMKSGTDNNL